MKRAAPIEIISFLVLIACAALCQNIPDAPSAHLQIPENRLEVRLSEGLSQADILTTAVREPASEFLTGQTSLTALYGPSASQRDSSILDKYLSRSLQARQQHYQPSTGGSFMSRATAAALHTFFTRDDSGKGKLSTSYLMGTLTSVVVDNAYRPYWVRSSASSTFNNFGSTIGSDAGMNVFHEFAPGIRRLLLSHAPGFVSRIEERVSHDQSSREAIFSQR
jgi:hypothetical protein